MMAQTYTTSSAQEQKSFIKPLAAAGFAFLSLGVSQPTLASSSAEILMARGTVSSPLVVCDRTRNSISFRSVASAIAAIRRKTDLSIENIGAIFGVSRKTVHNWSNGKTVAQDNEIAIYRVAGMFERTHGTPEQIRAALGTTNADGALIFDLLCQGKYEEVAAVLNVRSMSRGDMEKPIFHTRDKFIPAGYLAETETPIKLMGDQKLKSVQPIVTKRG